MERLYYSIGEVAQMLGESVSSVRFWSNYFKKFIHPHRTAKGNRQYDADDLAILRQVHLLVRGQGMTLPGAAMRLSEDRKSVESRVKAIEELKDIRRQLTEIRGAL